MTTEGGNTCSYATRLAFGLLNFGTERKCSLLRNGRFARAHPAFLCLNAFDADHVITNIGATIDERARLARFACLFFGYAVSLAINERLVAVRVIRDVAVNAGVFAEFKKT